MGRKDDVPNRQYTAEFKVEAVRLPESIGGNQAAKRLGIPDWSLWNWIRLSRACKLKGAIRRLRRSSVLPRNWKQRTPDYEGNWQRPSWTWRS